MLLVVRILLIVYTRGRPFVTTICKINTNSIQRGRPLVSIHINFTNISTNGGSLVIATIHNIPTTTTRRVALLLLIVAILHRIILS